MQEIRCPECDHWALESNWRDCEVYCEDCGEHMALECPNCKERFDEIFSPPNHQQLERRGL